MSVLLAMSLRTKLTLVLIPIALTASAVVAFSPKTARTLRKAFAGLPNADPSFDLPVKPRTARLATVALFAIILAGGAMRFVHLDRQIFWDDELWTMLRIGGMTDTQIVSLYDGRTLTAAQVDTLLYRRASAFGPVVKSLAEFEPQWPPLFYALEWLWSGLFGTSPAALRTLAAIFGTVLAPVVYWLGYELFRARAPAWYAACLVALSPAEIVYAREARGYSLLLLIAAASLGLLLYALRTRRMAPWYGFAALSILGLYDYLLYAPILAGELAYVAIVERFRWTAHARAAAIAAGLAALAFAPWLFVSVRNARALASGLPRTADSFSAPFYAGKTLLDIAMSFFASTYFNLDVAPIAVAVAIVVLLLAWRVARSAPRAALALTCFALPTILVTIAFDLAHNEHDILIFRYETPAWLALQLAVAGGLTWYIARSTGAARIAWSAASAALLIVCATSSALAIGQPTFWDSWFDAASPKVASIVNALPHPLILVTHDSDDIFVFAAALRPDVRIHFSKTNDYAIAPSRGAPAPDVLLLTATAEAPPAWRGAPLQRVYTFDGSASLVVRLRQRYHLHWLAYGLDPFVGLDTLWRPDGKPGST
jgi:uncharacterized membrane protein